jgi:dTDP-glucose 4,6-dehydratase
VELDEVLSLTPGLWDDLRGAHLFVTGGTGFFGCWLLETVLWANDRLELGASVTVLTRSPGRYSRKAPHLAGHPAVAVLGGDVRTFPFPPGRFSHVIHAATDSSGFAGTEAERFDTIVGGTARVLDFAACSGARRFLLTSSGAVYGMQPPTLAHMPEDYDGPPPVAEDKGYAEGKRRAESLCEARAASSALEPVIARCFAFVGPYLPLNAHFAIGNFIGNRLRGEPIHVRGDGTAVRSYLYAADLAIWLWTILLRGQALRPYNVGSPRAVSIAELAGVVASSELPAVQVQIAGAPVAGPVQRYVPDVSRAERELGLRLVTPLAEGIRRTLRWHRGQNPSSTTVDGGPMGRYS